MNNIDQLDARKETVNGLLSFSTTPYSIIVPSFQREYKWDATKIIDLFRHTDPDDVSFGFIGTMVFVRESNGSLEVVDGQQRLLSLLVILCAIRDYLKETSDKLEVQTPAQIELAKKCRAVSQSIQTDYIYKLDPVMDEELPRIKFHRPGYKIMKNNFLAGEEETDEKDNEGIISPYDTESKLFYKNYEAVKKALHEKYDNFHDFNDLIKLLQTRVKKLRNLAVNAIYINNPDYATEVFETINATGVTLRLPDLVKNYLFKAIKNESVEKDWSTIIVNSRGRDDDVERLVKYDWNIRYDVPEKELFRSIRKNTDNPQAYLAQLVKGSKILHFLEQPSVDSYALGNFWFEDSSNYKTDLISTVEALSTLSVKQYARLMLAIMLYAKGCLTIRDIIKILRLVESFQVRALVTKTRTGDIEKLYGNFSKRLYQISKQSQNNDYKKQAIRNLLFNDLPKEMKKIIPDDEFMVAFANFKRREGSTKDSRITKYFFSNIEKYLTRNEVKIDYKNRSTTVEEVLPKSYLEHWPGTTQEEQELIFNIGNMTVLQQVDNGSASNHGIESKIIIYEASNLKINAELVKAIQNSKKIWNKDCISLRAEKLADYALNIWTLDIQKIKI